MIVLRNVSFSFGDFRIFNKINLKISKGENTVIFGDNGSGKTTLCNIIAGLYPIKDGEVLIDGKDIMYWRKNKIPKVGVLFQNPDNQFIRYKVEDEVELSFKYVTKKRRIFKTSTEVINYFKLNNIRDRLINTLSGGEKQKLALACVVTNEPEYLLLDEPFAHLDPANEYIMRGILNQIRKFVTVIEISQKDSDDRFMRYIYMSSGKIVFDGDYRNFVKSNYNNSDVNDTISWLKRNSVIVPAHILSKEDITAYMAEKYGKN